MVFQYSMSAKFKAAYPARSNQMSFCKLPLQNAFCLTLATRLPMQTVLNTIDNGVALEFKS
jgi:hypothetical protein